MALFGKDFLVLHANELYNRETYYASLHQWLVVDHAVEQAFPCSYVIFAR